MGTFKKTSEICKQIVLCTWYTMKHQLINNNHISNYVCITFVYVCITFVQSRPTSTLGQHCTNVIQMFCVYWEYIRSICGIHDATSSRQTAVAANLSSQQLLLFAFVRGMNDNQWYNQLSSATLRRALLDPIFMWLISLAPDPHGALLDHDWVGTC